MTSQVAGPELVDAQGGWFQRVPLHWAVCKLGFRYAVDLGKMLDEKQQDGRYPMPYLRNQDVQWGLVNATDLPVIDIDPIEIPRYTVRDGDLLVCEGGDVGRAAIWRGSSGLIAYQKALHRLRPRDARRDDPRFLFYSLVAAKAAGAFDESDSKATISHLPADKFRQYRFAFPRRELQLEIASFLDRETARIDALIEKKTRFIELLREKRQAVITRAVAKGLDSTAPLKPSHVEWLDDVPVHWQVVQVRHVAQLGSGHTPSRERPDWWQVCIVPWFTLADVWQVRRLRKQFVFETEERISELGVANSSAVVHPAGSVMLSRTASVGFPAIMGCAMATSQDFAVWRCGPRLFNEFLYVVLLGMRREFDRVMIGSTHKTMYMPDIEAFRIALPPMSEQIAIVKHVEAAARRFESLLELNERSIRLLHERRAALISAAVTGQIDVRTEQQSEALEPA